MEHDDMDAGYESLSVHDPRILTKVECIGVERRTKPSKHYVSINTFKCLCTMEIYS